MYGFSTPDVIAASNHASAFTAYGRAGRDVTTTSPVITPFVNRSDSDESWRAMTSQIDVTRTWCHDLMRTTTSGYRTCYGTETGHTRPKTVGRESTNTLKAWLVDNIKNPYPSKGEKIMLAIMTKMTLTQVSTWFANARRRLKKDHRVRWRGDDDDDDDVDIEEDEDDDTDSEKNCRISDDSSSSKLTSATDRRSVGRRTSSTSDDDQHLNTVWNVIDPEGPGPRSPVDHSPVPFSTSSHQRSTFTSSPELVSVLGQRSVTSQRPLSDRSSSPGAESHSSASVSPAVPPPPSAAVAQSKPKIWSIVELITTTTKSSHVDQEQNSSSST